MKICGIVSLICFYLDRCDRKDVRLKKSTGSMKFFCRERLHGTGYGGGAAVANAIASAKEDAHTF
jgi:hypothetical protein